MCGWGMVHDGKFSLSSRYHGKKDSRNRRIFLCNFISFHSGMYSHRAQWDFFISGFSSCTRESANQVPFLTVKYHANLPVRRRRRCGVCATG